MGRSLSSEGFGVARGHELTAPEVQAVARALLKQERRTGEEVEALIEAAWPRSKK